MQWETSPQQAFVQGFDWYYAQLSDALFELAQKWAARIEAWLKQHAKWKDRTGNARQSLWAEAQHLINQIVIELDHGVSYGEFLEFSGGGTYAIIGPALDHFTPLIWKDVQALLSA